MKKFFQILCFILSVIFATSGFGGPFTYNSFSYSNPSAVTNFNYRPFAYNNPQAGPGFNYRNFDYHDFNYQGFRYNNPQAGSGFNYRPFTYNNPSAGTNFNYHPFTYNNPQVTPHFSYRNNIAIQPQPRISINIYPRFYGQHTYRIVPQRQIVCGYVDIGGLHDLRTGEYFPRIVKVCQ